MKIAVHFAVSAGLIGCAMDPGPSGVGNGRYMQIYNGTQVVYEMDVVAAGHMNCPNQVAMLVQKNPSLSGKCAHDPSTQPLPFSYKAHIQTNTGDEFKPSSPFVVRLPTSVRCNAAMKATLSQPKAVILEDHCGAPSNSAAPGVPAAATAATPPAAVQPAPIVQPTSSNISRDEATSLQKLKELRDKGLISQDEYEKKRREILDRL